MDHLGEQLQLRLNLSGYIPCKLFNAERRLLERYAGQPLGNHHKIPGEWRVVRPSESVDQRVLAELTKHSLIIVKALHHKNLRVQINTELVDL